MPFSYTLQYMSLKKVYIFFLVTQDAIITANEWTISPRYHIMYGPCSNFPDKKTNFNSFMYSYVLFAY